MKASGSILFLIVFAALFTGCKKDALKIHHEIDGHWQTAALGPGGTSITINNITSTYSSYEGEGGAGSGKARIEGNTLKIGRVNLEIIEYPHYDANGDYSMTIGNDVVIKSIAPRILSVQTFADHATLDLWFASPADHGITNGYFTSHLESMDLQYKIQTDTDWITINNWSVANNRQAQIDNLHPASVYQCRIKARYAWGDSDYSPITIFTTL